MGLRQRKCVEPVRYVFVGRPAVEPQMSAEKEPNNSIYSAASLALRVIFVRRKCLQIYALGMTILGERTEQHVVIGFGELAAVD